MTGFAPCKHFTNELHIPFLLDCVLTYMKLGFSVVILTHKIPFNLVPMLVVWFFFLEVTPHELLFLNA